MGAHGYPVRIRSTSPLILIMAYNPQLFESIRNRAWMVGLPERVKNVIAAYGCEKINFNRNMLIADIKSGEFPRRAVNAGPKTLEIVKQHLQIEDPCPT